jgi:hypothetical protein
VSHWTRRGIKKNGNITYRVFQNTQTLFNLDARFLVIEEDNVLQVQHGTRDDFEKYFNSHEFIDWDRIELMFKYGDGT